MLAMIWHEIVCWFLKIYQDLKRFATQEHRIVFVLIFRCAEQFYVPNMQEQSKTGKKSEINRQTFVIWWLNSRRYRSVWYSFSCKKKIPAYIRDCWFFSENHMYVYLFFDCFTLALCLLIRDSRLFRTLDHLLPLILVWPGHCKKFMSIQCLELISNYLANEFRNQLNYISCSSSSSSNNVVSLYSNLNS